MYFNKGNGNAEQGIPQGDAGMGKGAGIYDYKVNPVFGGVVNPFHQFILSVTLQALAMVARVDAGLGQLLIDVSEGGGAVDLWFASAEKI